jgi:hypothetical protein
MRLAKSRVRPDKCRVIEIKADSSIACGKVQKMRGRKMKDSLAMLLKTNGENLSVYRLLAMLMKTNWLYLLSRDVDEKAGGYTFSIRRLGCRGLRDATTGVASGSGHFTLRYRLSDLALGYSLVPLEGAERKERIVGNTAGKGW